MRFESCNLLRQWKIALVAVLVGAYALAGSASASTIIDDDFTSDPLATGGGWETRTQGNTSNESETWDGSSNETVSVTGPSGEGTGIGLIYTASDGVADMSQAARIRQRVTYGETSSADSNNNQRLLLLSDPGSTTFNFGTPRAFVQTTGSKIRVNSNSSTIISQSFSGSDLNGGQYDEDDYTEVVYDRTNLVALRYFDASANGGSGNTLTFFEDDPNTSSDDIAHGLDFNNFSQGGFTAVQAFRFGGGGKVGVYDGVTTEVTPIPEPGSLAVLGLLSLGGLLLAGRRGRLKRG